MTYDFDQYIERRNTESLKWRYYDEDVLPMWVADMDFPSPEPVVRALRERVEHAVFGYPLEPPELREVFVDRMQRLYGWDVSPDWLLFIPGVVTGFNLACRAVANPGEGVLVQTPVYYPILHAPANASLTLDKMELTRQPDGRYTVDPDLFEATITPQTRVFILCNPHNPVGRVFRRDELEQMAEICLRHDVVICSDEIHCDLIFSESAHLPIATLSPEVARQTITLMAPSKTYNIAGLHCSVAVIPNPKLRRRFQAVQAGVVPGVGIMGYVAALAAYREGQEWLDQVLQYLESNRDYMMQYVAEHLPGVRMARPEGTYLAWLDCREAGIPDRPHKFFLRQARVAVNDGRVFGRGGAGFVRLNFGCPRALLEKGLNRMREALAGLG